MSTKRRTIILSVQDDFSRQLRAFADQMDKAEDATYRFAKSAGGQGGTFGQMAFSLNQIIGAAQGVYNTFNQIYQTANEWKNLGVNAERSRMALEAYAGSAKEAERWLRAVADASRNTMSEGEAAAQAFTLMKFGLADTAEAAGQFVRDISIVSAINPQLGDTANAIQQIQLTIANMSWLRLDQLGISVGSVKKRIDELQKATKGLSQEEAFEIAVMEEIKAQADTVGDSILELTSNQDKLRAKWLGFREVAGMQINTAFEEIAGSLLDIINYLDTLSQMSAIEIVVSLTAGSVDSILKRVLGEEWETRIDPTTGKEVKYRDTGEPFLGSYVLAPSVLREIEQGLRFSPVDIPARGGVGLSAFRDQQMLAFYAAVAEAYMGPRGAFSVGPTAASRMDPYGLSPSGHFWLQEDPTMRRARDPLDRQAQSLRWFRERDMASMFQQWAREQAFMGRQSLYPTDFFGQLGRLSQQWRPGISYGPFEGALAPAWEMQRGATAFDSKEAWRQTRGADVAGAILEKFQVVPQIAGILLDGAEALEEAATKYASLNEKFGITQDTVDPLDIDVLSRVKDALGDVEIDAERAAEGIDAFEWAIGAATGSSEVFDARMAYLARHFAEGYLNAEEYADAVRRLSQLDYSWIDRVTEGMSFGESRTFIDQIMGLTTVGFRGMSAVAGLASDWGGKLQGAVSDPADTLRELSSEFFGLFDGGGMGAAAESPLSGLITDHERLAEMLQQNNEDTKNWYETQREYHELAATTTTNMVDSWIEDFVRAEPVLASLVSQYGALISIAGWSGWSSVMGGKLAAHAAAEGKVPPVSRTGGFKEFALGGYTGDGPSTEIAGLVHKGEYVISADEVRRMRSSSGRGRGRDMPTEPIQVQLMLDKRVIHEAVIDVDRQQMTTRRSASA